MKFNSLSFLFLLIISSGCRTPKPFYNKQEAGWESNLLPELKVKYSVFLIGSLGDPSDSSNEILAMLQKHTEQLDSNYAIVFLSNPDDPGCLVNENNAIRSLSEKELD